MKQIKILGTGCPKCQQTVSIVQNVVSEANAEATIEKVEDIMEIMKYDIMSTPAVVVDGVVKIKGKVPSRVEILELLSA